MKRYIYPILIIIVSILVGVSACRGKATPETPESPAVPEAPAIVPESDDIIVYPYGFGLSTEVGFRVNGLGSEGTLSVRSGGHLAVDLSFDRTTGEGRLTLAPDEGFSVGSSVVITTQVGDLSAECEINVQEAYLMPSLLTWQVEPQRSSMKVLVYTNVGFEAESRSPWISVDSSDEVGFVFSVSENQGSAGRSGGILVRDGKGILVETVSVVQEAPDHAQEIDHERAALKAVYEALHGEDWADSENWCTDAPLREWYGVMTNTFKGEEHVVYLHLQYLGAHGTIPGAIGDLRYLRELWIIGDEGITGGIPSSFGNLADLKDLSISGTSVSGPIPDCLRSLKKLEILGLDDNRLEGNLPLFLNDLPNLYNFGFSLNCLDGQVDPSLTKTRWWNTVDSQTGRTMGEENLLRGQKEGHSLWL